MANLKLIKILAEKKGISIRDLATQVGIKENQIHVMCRTNSTKIDTLERIAQVLNVSIVEFFNDSDNHIMIQGNKNQFNAKGAHHNTNASNAGETELAKLKTENLHLQKLINEKERQILTADERIKEYKERIEELKNGVK